MLVDMKYNQKVEERSRTNDKEHRRQVEKEAKQKPQGVECLVMEQSKIHYLDFSLRSLHLQLKKSMQRFLDQMIWIFFSTHTSCCIFLLYYSLFSVSSFSSIFNFLPTRYICGFSSNLNSVHHYIQSFKPCIFSSQKPKLVIKKPSSLPGL